MDVCVFHSKVIGNKSLKCKLHLSMYLHAIGPRYEAWYSLTFRIMRHIVQHQPAFIQKQKLHVKS